MHRSQSHLHLQTWFAATERAQAAGWHLYTCMSWDIFCTTVQSFP